MRFDYMKCNALQHTHCSTHTATHTLQHTHCSTHTATHTLQHTHCSTHIEYANVLQWNTIVLSLSIYISLCLCLSVLLALALAVARGLSLSLSASIAVCRLRVLFVSLCIRVRDPFSERHHVRDSCDMMSVSLRLSLCFVCAYSLSPYV